jgi:hypothetical protein
MTEDQQLARRYRAVLLLVHELHLRGYQRLRAAPAMSGSGMYWRCYIAPATRFQGEHGARLVYDWSFDDPLIASYSSSDEDSYFGWTDVTHQTTPSGLARRFVERFPKIVEEGRGSDWLYAGWYVEMLHLTYPNRFPYAMSDYNPDEYIPTNTYGGDSVGDIRIPLPPPGEAVEPSTARHGPQGQ